MLSPKLNVAFDIVPSVSRPAAVKVTDKGAEPDEVEVERFIQMGGVLVWAMVGDAVGGVVIVTEGEGDVVTEGVIDVVTDGEGDVPAQVFAVIESRRAEEPAAL